MRRDVFPAEIRMPDGAMVTGVRVFVTSHRLVAVAHDAQSGRMDRVVDLELVEPGSVDADRGTLGQGSISVLVWLESESRTRSEQGTCWVNAGTGCGCGSPLKALGTPVPWAGEAQAAAV